MKPYKIGIDLGGTNIKAGVVDADNHILVKLSCPTGAQRPWKEVADDIVRLALQALEQAGVSREDCAGVGMGCPGTVNAETGEVIYSNNFANWEYLPLGSYLTESLGMPVKMSNDANCAALGECAAGAAQGSASAVLLTLGTGVGGGVVWDGKVFEGGPGGMELGHTQLIHGGELCTCGRKGCIEAYCSANALIRQAQRAAEADPASLMNQLCGGDLSNMNGKIPFDAAQAGDKTAQAVIDQYLVWLGEAITDMVNIFRPQVVLISGGVCAQGEVLTKPLTEYVQENAFAGRRIPTPPVRIASLGSDAGLIGAACLVS
ncbi:ROK family protein [uncultured Allofournierella sp.]|uniref:ROK family protein n=1 Tax=uncultured Allofournierella sp. TaxID=1940258 RepID=UPI000B388FC6|nr:ROK family protein [uncultured Fournierella sp.]OUN15557.1 glucokinase [Gemmiger sp. An87]